MATDVGNGVHEARFKALQLSDYHSPPTPSADVRFRVPGSGFRDPGFGFRVSGFGTWVPGFATRDPGFGLQV